MATKTFKIGLSNTDKQNMAQDVYERVLALTFNEYDTTTEYEVGDFVVFVAFHRKSLAFKSFKRLVAQSIHRLDRVRINCCAIFLEKVYILF